MSIHDLSLIIPAYNEAESIGEVVRRMRAVFDSIRMDYELTVVDDGSTDRTGEEAAAAGAVVVRRPINLGYGNALKLGVCRARYAHVAICDADMSYDPADFLKLLPFAESFDMVVGARTGQEFLGYGMKRIARWFQLTLVRLTVGQKIPDANSGMRIFRKMVLLRFLEGLCGGFSFTTSISLAMHSTFRTVTYVPISYSPRVGSSHVRFVMDTLRSTQILLQAILKYNPLKAFLFLMFLPLCLSLLSLATSVPFLLLGSRWLGGLLLLNGSLALISSFLIFALGMLAYAVQNRPEPGLDYSDSGSGAAVDTEPAAER